MKLKIYSITVLNGMVRGLFCSLIIGVIIKQIGSLLNINELIVVGEIAQYFMGPCIAASIAIVLKSSHYTIISSIVAGAIGAGTFKVSQDVNTLIFTTAVGEPVGSLITGCFAAYIGSKVENKTKFDLLLVPATIIIASSIISIFIAPPINLAMKSIGSGLNDLTNLNPILMGFLLAVIVGVILTTPIMSSAALCISINIDGLAAGAALAGCCAQMIGFAFMSFKVNGFSGLLSQGLGTTKIQAANIVKNPWIIVPPTIASGICGVLSTEVFKIVSTSVGAGMGTSGLVGQFATLSIMGVSAIPSMLILHFLLPAIISIIFFKILNKLNKVKYEDLTL